MYRYTNQNSEAEKMSFGSGSELLLQLRIIFYDTMTITFFDLAPVKVDRRMFYPNRIKTDNNLQKLL